MISPLLYRDEKLFSPFPFDIFRSSAWRHDGAYSSGVAVICFCETGFAAGIRIDGAVSFLAGQRH